MNMNNMQEIINNLLLNNQNNNHCECNDYEHNNDYEYNKDQNQNEEILLNDLFEPIYLYLNILLKRIQNFESLTQNDYLNLLSLIWNEKNSEISNKLLNSFIDIILYNLFNNLKNNNDNQNFDTNENNDILKYLPFDSQENKTIDEQILKNILHDRIRNNIL